MANNPLSKYKPRILIEMILLGITHRFSSEDVYVNDVFYERKLLNEPSIIQELSDSYYGTLKPKNVKIEMSNIGDTPDDRGYFSELDSTTALDFRNAPVKIIRYDEEEDVTNFEIYGNIVDYNLNIAKANFTVATNSPDILQTFLPQKVHEVTDFPTDRTDSTAIPTVDLGKPYNIIFGNAEKVPLVYVYGETTSDVYDYIIGYGVIEGVANLYHDKVLIAPSDYTAFDGSQSSPYAGFAFVRFNKEQRNFQDNMMELHGDINGLEMGGSTANRKFGISMRELLNDSTWGLNEAVDSTSFDADITNVYCDGFIGGTRRKASDVIRNMLFSTRASLEKNNDNEWTFDIDSYDSTSQADFGLKDGLYENIVDIVKYKKVPTKKAIKTLALKYRHNTWTNRFVQINSRNVNAFGEEKEFSSMYIRDHTTADILTSYLKSLMLEGDKELTIEVAMEGRNLANKKIVTVHIPDLNLDAILFKIKKITKLFSEFELETYSYSPDIYTYVPGSIPTDEIPDDIGGKPTELPASAFTVPANDKLVKTIAHGLPVKPWAVDIKIVCDNAADEKYIGVYIKSKDATNVVIVITNTKGSSVSGNVYLEVI
jgi:hypothetical protein